MTRIPSSRTPGYRSEEKQFRNSSGPRSTDQWPRGTLEGRGRNVWEAELCPIQGVGPCGCRNAHAADLVRVRPSGARLPQKRKKYELSNHNSPKNCVLGEPIGPALLDCATHNSL